MQAWPYLEPPKEVLLAAEKEAGDDPLYPRRDSGHWSTPPLPSASPDIIATDLGLSPEQNTGKNQEPSTLDLALKPSVLINGFKSQEQLDRGHSSF